LDFRLNKGVEKSTVLNFQQQRGIVNREFLGLLKEVGRLGAVNRALTAAGWWLPAFKVN
jgi:hypothetical protein